MMLDLGQRCAQCDYTVRCAIVPLTKEANHSELSVTENFAQTISSFKHIVLMNQKIVLTV